MTAWQPVSRQRRSKISGGPRRRLSTTSPSPSRKADSTSAVSLRRAPDCRSWSSLPVPSLRPPQRGDDILPDGAAIAAALDDLQVAAFTNELAAEKHAGLVGCTTPMHQTSASVNAFHANRVALHFRPIFDSRPRKPQKSAIFLPQPPPK